MAIFTTDWFTRHVPTFEKQLVELKDRDDLTFLEVGCFEGRSTMWLIENYLMGKNSKIYCIDTFQGSREHESMNVETEGLYERFTTNLTPYIDKIELRVGLSGVMLRTLELDSFDFIYIDGCHAALNVLEDAVLAWGLLKSGGIMAFDDYFWSHFSNRQHEEGVEIDEDALLLEPALAIDSFLAVYRTKYQLLHHNEQVFIKKL